MKRYRYVIENGIRYKREIEVPFLLFEDEKSGERLFGEPDATRATLPEFSARLEIRPGCGTPGAGPFVVCVITSHGDRRLGDLWRTESLTKHKLMRDGNPCSEWLLVETLRECMWMKDGKAVKLSAFNPARDALAELVALGNARELRTLAASFKAMAERIEGEEYNAASKADNFLSALVLAAQETGELPTLEKVGKLAGLDSRHRKDEACKVGFGWLPSGQDGCAESQPV